MIHKLIDTKILADYLKSNQAQVEEIIRDQKAQEEKSQLAQTSEPMLTVKEAAKLISFSEDWLYRNAKKLPFARKLGPKNLRFSKSGLDKWVASRQVN